MSRARNLILLLLVLVCGASFWLARREGAVAVAPPRGSATAESQSVPVMQTAHLAVLNGTGVNGLARRISRLVPALGCVVTRIDDAPSQDFATSLLVNRRLEQERAEALAAELGVKQVLHEWDARCDEDAVLVLGADHARILARLGG